MQKYEMLILLKSDLEEEAREAELKKYADIVASYGGSVESTDKWGVKKTAYTVNFKSDAFYALISAAVRIVKSRKHGSPILSAAKAVSFAAALVSMLSLTTAMLARFGGGDDGDFRRIMTASVGGGVCAIVIATAVYMIARAQKNLKKGDFNKTQTKSERFGNDGRL